MVTVNITCHLYVSIIFKDIFPVIEVGGDGAYFVITGNVMYCKQYVFLSTL